MYSKDREQIRKLRIKVFKLEAELKEKERKIEKLCRINDEMWLALLEAKEAMEKIEKGKESESEYEKRMQA